MRSVFILPSLWLALGFAQSKEPSSLPTSTPWDLPLLTSTTPESQWLDTEAPREVRPLLYAGGAYEGKPTSVFAWYASPTTLGLETERKTFPGIVLVHGGGGTAFANWAEIWARRGYAAIAMDLAGCGENRMRLPDGGPGQGDDTKFGAIDSPIEDQWTYHAVANVIQAHSLLRSFAEVQGEKTALTGISWGGYLTCIVSGLDQRFSVAMPVYGCGFLRENSVWVESSFSKMTHAQSDRWHRLWDPSRYLGAATMPVMFLNGTHDFAYPLDSYAKTCALVSGEKNYSIQLKMAHGHLFEFPEFFGFIDQYIRGATPMPVVSHPSVKDDKVTATVTSSTDLTTAQLHYTMKPHLENKDRPWTTIDLEIDGKTISGPAPPTDATAWYMDVRDERNLLVSSKVMVPMWIADVTP
ncbi:MAG: pimeloyl-ACP methyl ester carboxylesterase [Verrucomicrobiales bacterium]|jgi:pimeloyl-ACP methyl ester carboxylesterase